MAMKYLSSSIAIAAIVASSLCAGCGGQQSPADDSDSSVGASANQTYAQQFLAEHNQVRASVTRPANYASAFTPLPPLSWSETLANEAQAWAKHLANDNACNLAYDPTTPYGDNLAFGSVGFGPTQAVALWGQDAATYVYQPEYVLAAGNYTQMIWRTTTQLGCAMAACSTGWRIHVCLYNPAGNVLGEPPF
jgi:pathogenesis-related protein 1